MGTRRRQSTRTYYLDYGDYQNDIAIINSHIDYPNPDLSGAGVALKLVQGYCATYGLQYPMRLYGLAAWL